MYYFAVLLTTDTVSSSPYLATTLLISDKMLPSSLAGILIKIEILLLTLRPPAQAAVKYPGALTPPSIRAYLISTCFASYVVPEAPFSLLLPSNHSAPCALPLWL